MTLKSGFRILQNLMGATGDKYKRGVYLLLLSFLLRDLLVVTEVGRRRYHKDGCKEKT